MQRKSITDKVKSEVQSISRYSLGTYEHEVKLNQNENPYDVPMDIKRAILDFHVRVVIILPVTEVQPELCIAQFDVSYPPIGDTINNNAFIVFRSIHLDYRIGTNIICGQFNVIGRIPVAHRSKLLVPRVPPLQRDLITRLQDNAPLGDIFHPRVALATIIIRGIGYRREVYLGYFHV